MEVLRYVIYLGRYVGKELTTPIMEGRERILWNILLILRSYIALAQLKHSEKQNAKN